MPVYDGDLKELQRRAARRAQIQAQLRELETQRSALEARVEELAVVLHDERADVVRLETGGLTAFFYSLLGKGEEKLDKERREAAAAALKYESAARELAEAEDDIERLRAELGELEGAHEEYERALQSRAEELRRSGGQAGRVLLRIESEIAAEESRQKELVEAIAAGILARQEEISARDERNVALGNAAKARAFALFSIGFPWILMIFALLELKTLPLLVLIGFYLLVEIVFLAARVRLEREN